MLTAGFETALKAPIQDFLQYLTTERSKSDRAERLRRIRYFQEQVPGKLQHLSEVEVTEIVSQLWASQIFGNKQYLVGKVIEANGLDGLREELSSL